MMNKHPFCNGFQYNYSSRDNYWEGTRERTNENPGTVRTQPVVYVG